jgi:hypothetical protein
MITEALMDRRQRKLQEKRKKRDIAKKKARLAAAQRPDRTQLIIRAAARGPFGPCGVSAGWDRDGNFPELVGVVVTRRLPDGDLVPATALVDRTCLGIKSAFAREKMPESEFDDLFEELGAQSGGMERCEALVAQSIVFHAIDYANRLGFVPDRDFPEELFGPRPPNLLMTPWHAADKPIYMPGPHDDVPLILARLTAAVGSEGFEMIDMLSHAIGDDGDADEAWEDDGDDLGDDEESPSDELTVAKR